MTESLITALLSADFDGCQFETLGNGSYSMTDDENTIVLTMVADRWQVWIDLSLCIQGELEECIDWINEYLS